MKKKLKNIKKKKISKNIKKYQKKEKEFGKYCKKRKTGKKKQTIDGNATRRWQIQNLALL